MKTKANLCPSIFTIDRSIPVCKLGPMLPVWLGPKERDGLQGEPDDDPRSISIATFDANKAVAITGLVGNETIITGEERRLRIRNGAVIPIDFHTGWNLCYTEKDQKNLRWMYDNGKIENWFETNTVLLDPKGLRCHLSFYRKVDGSWDWSCCCLSLKRIASEPALGLASS